MVPESPKYKLADFQFERLLTTDEAAAILGVQPQTLVSWRCTGSWNLPYIRVGRLVRYRLEDLRVFCEENRVVAGE